MSPYRWRLHVNTAIDILHCSKACLCQTHRRGMGFVVAAAILLTGNLACRGKGV